MCDGYRVIYINTIISFYHLLCVITLRSTYLVLLSIYHYCKAIRFSVSGKWRHKIGESCFHKGKENGELVSLNWWSTKKGARKHIRKLALTFKCCEETNIPQTLTFLNVLRKHWSSSRTMILWGEHWLERCPPQKTLLSSQNVENSFVDFRRGC